MIRLFSRRRMLYLALCFLLLIALTLVEVCNPQGDLVPTAGTEELAKGVWINYYEYAEMIDGKSQEAYCQTIHEVMERLVALGANLVFLHLRSHSDSLYPSTIFPWSQQINQGEGVPYDPLTLFLQAAHQKGIQVHGWLNPYRISVESLQELSPKSPAYSMREDELCVVETDNGVYYNPASPKIRRLVLSGVRELLDRYELDGIQYDDYFYPTADASFDQSSYAQYCQTASCPLPLEEWRRCQVNLLIAGTYQLTQQYNVVFGVSPGADIEKNNTQLFADVAAWVQGGYVDYLCPQLYFGFSYPKEAFRFDALLKKWKKLAGDVPLYIGLASYKVGLEDAGSTEWVSATDLLARQHSYGINEGVDGICIYHYSSLMKEDKISVAQREHLTRLWNS